jgi:outer membrane protein OmpA-like peptidoglycan-associated protein
LPPLPQPAAAPEPASEAPAAPKPTAAEKSPPAKDESAALPAVVATAQPAPAPAAPAVVAGGLLGGGDISEPVGAVNVPPRAAPSVPRERQQTAAVAPPAGSGGGFRVGFSGSSADLSPAAQSQLAELAQLLVGGSDRIMLNGYASGESASGARRVALSRVLAVRAFLVDKGVQQPRIDVRAVGTPNDGGSPERVDIAKIGR